MVPGGPKKCLSWSKNLSQGVQNSVAGGKKALALALRYIPYRSFVPLLFYLFPGPNKQCFKSSP